MSQQEFIIRGEVQQRKLAQAAVLNDAKAALGALIVDSVTSKMKPIADINTELLQAHLNRLCEKQKEWNRLEKEIKELEY
jgi:alpha-galactosidase/6-phospho-beta-glucosidase family protein